MDLKSGIKNFGDIFQLVPAKSLYDKEMEPNPIEEAQDRVTGPPSPSAIHLWQFLLELLIREQDYSHAIKWTDKDNFEFKFLDPEEVSRLWGVRKQKPSMNYEKLSRGLRYYYEKGIMQKIHSQKYVYRFMGLDPGDLTQLYNGDYASPHGGVRQFDSADPPKLAPKPPKLVRATAQKTTPARVFPPPPPLVRMPMPIIRFQPTSTPIGTILIPVPMQAALKTQPERPATLRTRVLPRELAVGDCSTTDDAQETRYTVFSSRDTRDKGRKCFSRNGTAQKRRASPPLHLDSSDPSIQPCSSIDVETSSEEAEAGPKKKTVILNGRVTEVLIGSKRDFEVGTPRKRLLVIDARPKEAPSQMENVV